MKTKYQYKAIITDKKGNVLSIGENNLVKTHPYMAKMAKSFEPRKIFLHAEIHAILRCKDLSKAKYIQIFRVNKDGSCVIHKPCEICASAIESLGLILKL